MHVLSNEYYRFKKKKLSKVVKQLHKTLKSSTDNLMRYFPLQYKIHTVTYPCIRTF